MPARMHQVEIGSSTEGWVTEGRQLKVQHFVNLHYRTWTCRVYQEMGIPCEHALACILQLGQSPQQYLPEDLSTEVLIPTTFIQLFILVWLHNLRVGVMQPDYIIHSARMTIILKLIFKHL